MAEPAADEKLIDVLQFISKERNIPFEMLLEALEAALLTAYKRHYGSEANAIVIVDRQTGEYKVFHRRIVVETSRIRSSRSRRSRPERRISPAISSTKKSRRKISAASPRKRRSKSSCSASAKPSATRFTTSTRAN